MAAAMRGLFRLGARPVNNAFLRNNISNVHPRFIFTDRALGLTGYENARLSYRNQFVNIENSFRTKMNEVCNQEGGMIFTEDLKAMLYLLQKRDEDLTLIQRMIERFVTQSDEFRFGNFIFGPVVMRMCYYLDEPEIALNLFKNPKLTDFFSQIITYQLLMSLLYKHRNYAAVRETYDLIKEKCQQGSEHPMNILNILFASCYKENSQESYDYALQVWKEIKEKNLSAPRRAVAFIVALAINQNAPHVAIELLSHIRIVRSMEARNLKTLAYGKLQKFTQIIPILRPSLEWDSQNARKEIYFSDVIELVESELKNQPGENDELLSIIINLKRNGHITSDTLDIFLSRPIDYIRRPQAMRSGVQDRPLRSFEKEMSHM